MTATERWLPIPGWEGIYEVSDQGRVRSLDREVVHAGRYIQQIRGRVLKSTVNPQTRRNQIYLWRDNKQHTCRVYALVASAFIGRRPDGHEVRHLNGDVADDRAVNLAYGTHSENELDKVRHGTHKEARRTHCKNSHPFDAENTYFVKGLSARKCKACARANSESYRQRKRSVTS